ncbi:MAG: sulfite exporter TauE/SafE family protein [Deltaproteobacteria bacterium]|nr:sulfite exporter TauE/SafE family protein [Deltaproteobacteria bacterium]
MLVFLSILPLVLPLGLAAGALTTIAGLGGGMMLVLVFSLLWDVPTALAVSAPALLLGNLHRVWLFRRSVDRRLAKSLALGALPASFLGGLFAVAAPVWVLHWLLVATTAFAVAKKLGLVTLSQQPRAMVPVGIGAGFLTATSGGGGLMVAPVLLASGLRAEAYVATGAVTAVAMHIGRIGAYGFGGLIDGESLLTSLALAVAIIFGNALGKGARPLMSEGTKLRIAWGAMASAVALALAGVT